MNNKDLKESFKNIFRAPEKEKGVLIDKLVRDINKIKGNEMDYLNLDQRVLILEKKLNSLKDIKTTVDKHGNEIKDIRKTLRDFKESFGKMFNDFKQETNTELEIIREENRQQTIEINENANRIAMAQNKKIEETKNESNKYIKELIFGIFHNFKRLSLLTGFLTTGSIGSLYEFVVLEKPPEQLTQDRSMLTFFILFLIGLGYGIYVWYNTYIDNKNKKGD
jgi:hypothetical protein